MEARLGAGGLGATTHGEPHIFVSVTLGDLDTETLWAAPSSVP
jgi:hypothetical protein